MSELKVNLLDTASCTLGLAIIQAQLGGNISVNIETANGYTLEGVNDASTQPPATGQISTNPENRQPVEENDDDAGEGDPSQPDTAGNMWNPEFHTSPPKTTKAGTWRIAPGKADAFKAYLEAQKQPAPEHTEPGALANSAMPGMGGAMPGMPGMGGAMPGIEGNDTPPPAPDYETMCNRFIAMSEAGKIPDPLALYKASGVTDPNALMTNETLRAALWAELDKIDAQG